MTMLRKLVAAEISTLDEDEVEVIIATSALARDGHVIVPQGARLENYRANPIVLWQHSPDKPVGNALEVTVENDRITARVRFAPLGISEDADRTRGLVKAGVVRAVSIGFDPVEGEPLDPRRPKGGQRFTSWDLLEFSFVSVGSDTGALVTARAHGETDMPESTEATKARAAAPVQRVAIVRDTAPVFARALYSVANLCYLFEQLGYQVDQSKYEAAIEGDQSAVPGMLAEVLISLGEALIAMTEEEVAEALAAFQEEPEEDEGDNVLTEEARAHVRAAPSAGVRAFRRGLAHAHLRAGKSLSAETVRCLRDARDMHDEGLSLHRSAMRKHKEGISAIDDLLARAGVSEPDSESLQTVQTSSGTGVDEGSEGQRAAADFRRRQADILSLSASA